MLCICVVHRYMSRQVCHCWQLIKTKSIAPGPVWFLFLCRAYRGLCNGSKDCSA